MNFYSSNFSLLPLLWLHVCPCSILSFPETGLLLHFGHYLFISYWNLLASSRYLFSSYSTGLSKQSSNNWNYFCCLLFENHKCFHLPTLHYLLLFEFCSLILLFAFWTVQIICPNLHFEEVNLLHSYLSNTHFLLSVRIFIHLFHHFFDLPPIVALLTTYCFSKVI